METLSTRGLEMPRLGLGTYRMAGEACAQAVEHALSLGYRHIDTAEMYENEEGVGAGLAVSSVPRADIFLTTKVWHDHLTRDGIRRALDGSLEKLKTDHVDLYLVHWPAPDMDMGEIFETMAALKEEGLIKAMGAANFTVDLMKSAVEEIGAPIACNQVEYHVKLDQSKLLGYLRAKDIPLVAYVPLGQGRLADEDGLVAVAEKHGASPAQIALAWLMDQDGVAAIPKAGRLESQQANLDALKITLDDEDRKVIAALPKDQRYVDPSFAPDCD
ncbi:2,5-diketo-D-gluconate reductase B [Breoghania corrubedonensis]|uniref:2,5-diketo-D-gluconate reductase B n=1 Tax=Breoghania corrubedonensis TaxID=665038 RepID=A0A2T5V5Q4_9HYPH|nr:aldo/keto reductase [Breoghania corrubedonensis]PTW59080.1 2,5-diketo-D-gluconate reductase B [Breoghania corrubedonensis]